MRDRPPAYVTIILGVVPIVGFGVWFYGFGVLLEPIREDTGWSEAVLTSTYGLSSLGAGILAIVVGRLLPRHGPRRLYLLGAALVPVAYLLAAAATSQTAFAIAGVAAGSITGALGYYAAVHTILALLVPTERRSTAITTNTIWGAFASPIFLPLMAWLVLSLDWRATLRLSGAAVAAVFVLTATLAPAGPGTASKTPPLRAAVAAAVRDRVVVALVVTTFAGGFAGSLLILYQVPVMVSAGLTVAMASGLAGARGLLQLVGRLPLPWLLARTSSGVSLRSSHLLLGASCALLPFAGWLPLAVLFAVVAGIAVGALLPLESIFSADAIPIESLGMVLGVSSLTRGIGGALGPVLGGSITAATGTRTAALLLSAGVALVAAVLVPVAAAGQGRRSAGAAGTSPPASP